MTRHLKFNIEYGKWFVELPEWKGDKCELQMVMGADSFLDILAQGEPCVELILSTEPINGCEELKLVRLGDLEGPEMSSGAWYQFDKYKDTPFMFELWLCDVTKFVFGEFPSSLYFVKQESLL